MKKKNKQLSLWIFIFICVFQFEGLTAKEHGTIVFLSDPEYEQYMMGLEQTDDPLDTEVIESEKDFRQMLLDGNPPPESVEARKYERLERRTRLAQARLLTILEEFVETDFDAADDERYERFNELRTEIVKLTFYSETERAWYERLFIINQFWLNYMDQPERFSSLYRALRDRWLEIEEFRMKVRESLMVGGYVIGGIAGGFLGYKMATKFFTVSATNGALTNIWKWTARAGAGIVGAYVGAIVAQRLALAAGNAMFNQYIFFNPIDNEIDLGRDLLQVIDDL